MTSIKPNLLATQIINLLIICVASKFGLPPNCRKEIELADSASKQIITILLQKGPDPMALTLSLIKYYDFRNNLISWNGDYLN